MYKEKFSHIYINIFNFPLKKNHIISVNKLTTGGSDMYCVVINKLKGIYMLRHIIYGINPKESMSSIKKNYYKNYCRTDTDTFYLCKNKKEINKLLLMHKIF